MKIRRIVKFVRAMKGMLLSEEDEGRETFRSPFGPAPPTHLPKPAPVFLSVNFQDTS